MFGICQSASGRMHRVIKIHLRMALPYFYEPNIGTTGTLVLSEETSKHCVQVLRMQNGEALQLTDGLGNLFSATIANAHKRHCTVHIQQQQFIERQLKEISIGISLLKNASRLEWFLEKATEIGVAEIIPLLCQRTEKQHFRYDRMQNILIAAMLQSQQTWLPVLQVPTPFASILANDQPNVQRLIAHCEPGNKTALPQLNIQPKVQLLIGPEGDFSTAEIDAALTKNYTAVSLGNTRLRTETAGVVAATLLANS